MRGAGPSAGWARGKPAEPFRLALAVVLLAMLTDVLDVRRPAAARFARSAA